MSQATTFFQLGAEHILEWNSYDHMLFLLVMLVPFTFKEWKPILGWITAFTVGHALTLILSGTGWLSINTSWVELGIALTILLSALYYLVFKPETHSKLIYLMVLFFGLIHGLGFAGYIKVLLGPENETIWPLLFFNLGVEVGQVIFVGFALLFQTLLLRMNGFRMTYWKWVICGSAILLSLNMIIERA